MVWRLKNIETGDVHEYTNRDRVKRMLAERDGTPMPNGIGGVHYPNPKFELVAGEDPFSEPTVLPVTDKIEKPEPRAKAQETASGENETPETPKPEPEETKPAPKAKKPKAKNKGK